jgi:hypothetical protein
MGDRVGCQRAFHDDSAGIRAAQCLDQLAGELCRFRLVAEEARGDQQNFAHTTLQSDARVYPLDLKHLFHHENRLNSDMIHRLE